MQVQSLSPIAINQCILAIFDVISLDTILLLINNINNSGNNTENTINVRFSFLLILSIIIMIYLLHLNYAYFVTQIFLRF